MSQFKLKLFLGMLFFVTAAALVWNFVPVWAAQPTIANAIPNQNATANAAFNFQFAANTFNDSDVGDSLTYSAQLTGGGALPAWLSFDPVTRTFSGTPLNAHIGTVSIDVIADDGNGGTVTDTFDIVVSAAATAVPFMDAPASNATYGTIPVDFALGENPLAGSIHLTFVGTSTITIDLQVASPAVGPYDYSINPTDIMATGAPILSASQNTIPDGAYTVVLSYQSAAGGTAASAIATNVTVNTALVDTDSDGSLDSVEEAGPNNGDANDDGIADIQQANIYSYMNPITSAYAVLETNCERIENFQIGSESSQMPDLEYDYPMGLASFWIHCANAGDTARIRLYYYGVEGSELYSVRKWMNDGSYREIPGYQPLGVLIGGDVIFMTEYEITDGTVFDDDGNQDAVIRDPSGAALRVAQVSATSSANTSTVASSLASTGVNAGAIFATVLTLIGTGALSTTYFLRRKLS